MAHSYSTSVSPGIVSQIAP